MIIPVRCFTCGKVLADKYKYYLENVRQKKISLDIDEDKVLCLTPQYIKKTLEGISLDELKL